MIGTRTRCIRERAARRRAPSKLCTQGPGFRKDPGPFVFRLQPACALAQTRDRKIAPPTLSSDGGCSLTTCRKTTSVLADGLSCTFCGCSSVGRARPRHGRGHEFETRHPLHFGCVLSLRGRVTWCWRCGMCATQGLSHVQRDTTSDGMLAFGHSRSGGGYASSLSAKRGTQLAAGRRPRADARAIPHATPEQGTHVELTLRGWKSAATIGRRRNP